MVDPIRDQDQTLRVGIPVHRIANIPEVHNIADRVAVPARILGKLILYNTKGFSLAMINYH